MALTPEDVKFKEFPETKFRPGYDKDEVDDFLDEIFNEWVRLIEENRELQDQVSRLEQQLEDDPSNVEPVELEDAGLSGYAGSSAESTGYDEAAAADAAEAESAEAEPQAAAEQTEEPEYAPGTRPARARPEPTGTAAHEAAGASAAGVLAMAQQLHDQYVAEGEQTRAAYIAEGEEKRAAAISEGEETRDAAIAEGERRRDEIVTAAQEHSATVREEAEQTASRTLSTLERDKAELESRVNELTVFERDYRARLKDYIEGQLQELTSRGPIDREAAQDHQ